MAHYTMVKTTTFNGVPHPAIAIWRDASGQRLTLYVSTENTSNRDTAFRFAQEGPVNVFYWIDGPIGYAVTGEISRERLQQRPGYQRAMEVQVRAAEEQGVPTTPAPDTRP